MASSKQKEKFCPYCGSCIERYFSADTAAKLTDLSPEYFRKLIKERKINVVRFGRAVRIPASVLFDFAESYPSINKIIKDLNNS